jgi:DNA-binding FadR family transcriptional regulator
MQPHFVRSFEKLAEDPKAAERLSQAIGLVIKTEFERDPIHTVLATGFEQSKAKPTNDSVNFGGVDAAQLVDVVLRNPLFLEAVYELRLITERYAALEAAKHVENSQIKQLVAHLDYMTAIADSSPSQYSKLDTELHQLIVECTHNPVFAVINAALSPVFSRTTNQWLKKHMEMRSDQSTIHLQHTQIVEAVVARDPEKAQVTMDEHLAYVLRNLRHLRQQDQLQEIAIARRLLR